MKRITFIYSLLFVCLMLLVSCSSGTSKKNTAESEKNKTTKNKPAEKNEEEAEKENKKEEKTTENATGDQEKEKVSRDSDEDNGI